MLIAAFHLLRFSEIFGKLKCSWLSGHGFMRTGFRVCQRANYKRAPPATPQGGASENFEKGKKNRTFIKKLILTGEILLVSIV